MVRSHHIKWQQESLSTLHRAFYGLCLSSMSWFNAIFFFPKFLEDISPFAGPLIPLFWTSGNFSGFQSQSGQSYSCLAEAYVLHRQGCVQYFPGDGGSGVRSSMAGKKCQTYMLRIFCLEALGTCWEGSGWWWGGGGLGVDANNYQVTFYKSCSFMMCALWNFSSK